MTDDQVAILRLAGFALAHAAFSVEDGETLCTLAMIEVDGERELARYEADSIPESAEFAHQHLRERLAGGGYAALVVDAFATTEAEGRTDALLIELLDTGGHSLGHVIQQYRRRRRFPIPFIPRWSGFAILGDPLMPPEMDDADARRVLLDSAREHPQAGRLFVG